MQVRQGYLTPVNLKPRLKQGSFFAEPLHLLPGSHCMSLRADMYRQKAAEAKRSAAQAKNPFLKRAFEDVARGWLVLAEQMEWTSIANGSSESEAMSTFIPVNEMARSG